MNESPLPDDMRHWPQDPYALLGVPGNVSIRHLKKAYAQLIRRFRPEQHPEQFRRIRDAYEIVQQQIKFAGQFAPPPAEENREQPLPEAAAPPPIFEIDSRPEAPPVTGPSQTPLQQEISQLWEQACAGKEELAYGRLREIYREDPREKEVPLQLFWLLRLLPGLEPARHPCDWLVEHLNGAGLAAPARELYRRFLASHPTEAVSERYERLIRSSSAAKEAPAFLAPYFEWRWQAIAGLRREAQLAGEVESDLDWLEGNLAPDDGQTHARLLFAAADQLAWFPAEPVCRVFRRCCEELDRVEHLSTHLGESYSRLDFLKELSGAWKQGVWRQAKYMNRGDGWLAKPVHGDGFSAGEAPSLPGLLRLIPLTWTSSYFESRTVLQRYFENAWDDPLAVLDLFDEIRTSSPLLISQLAQALDALLFEGMPPGREDAEEIEARTRRFLRGMDARDYGNFHQELLLFCCREFLAPERIAEVILSGASEPGMLKLFARVRDDLPLRCLCKAHRLFRS